MNWEALVGMKIVALRGYKKSKGMSGPACPFSFILFGDKKTYLELDEQDQHDYHDCNSNARTLNLRHDAARWQQMFDKEGNFDEPTNLACPF